MTINSNTLENRLGHILEFATDQKNNAAWHYARCATPLGDMLIVANNDALVLVDFVDRTLLENKLLKLKRIIKSPLILKDTPAIVVAKKELTAYFEGKFVEFTTPLLFMGTDFQKKAWRVLQKISFGTTQSYLEQARLMKMPNAVRAVANANGANLFTIIIPCHRVINHHGGLGGYAGGLDRKRWLLAHEAHNIKGA